MQEVEGAELESYWAFPLGLSSKCEMMSLEDKHGSVIRRGVF